MSKSINWNDWTEIALFFKNASLIGGEAKLLEAAEVEEINKILSDIRQKSTELQVLFAFAQDRFRKHNRK